MRPDAERGADATSTPRQTVATTRTSAPTVAVEIELVRDGVRRIEAAHAILLHSLFDPCSMVGEPCKIDLEESCAWWALVSIERTIRTLEAVTA